MKQTGELTGEPMKKIIEPTGEYEQKPILNRTDPKGNEASGSRGKGKVFDDEEEKEKLFDGEKLDSKKRDKEFNDLLRVRKELKDQEREAKIAKVTLAT